VTVRYTRADQQSAVAVAVEPLRPVLLRALTVQLPPLPPQVPDVGPSLWLRSPHCPLRRARSRAMRCHIILLPRAISKQPLMHWLQGDLLHKRVQHWSIPATGYRCYRTRSRRVCAPRSPLLWRSGSTEANSLQTSSKIHSKSEKRDSSGLTETDPHMKMWYFRLMQ